jgi:hypothetical protein
MTEGRQTVAGAYLKIAGHEELCAERYRVIQDALADLKSVIRWVARGAWAGAFLLLAWALVQLYTLEPLRREAARIAPPAEQRPYAAPGPPASAPAAAARRLS